MNVGSNERFVLEAVEITLPALHRRVFSREDGTFLLNDVKPGKYEIRARKLGFAPEILQVKMDTAGGTIAFMMLPLPYVLDPVVTTVARGGLSGVVGDTSFQPIAGAEVRVMGKDLWAVSDSSGAFHIPVSAGSYLVAVRQSGYDYKLVSVIVPPDSGRRITVNLAPLHRKALNREVHNLDDFQQRLTWRYQRTSRVYTRADLEKMEIAWVSEVVRMAGGDLGAVSLDDHCYAVVNGGPDTDDIDKLTVAEIESVEIYASAVQSPAAPRLAPAGTMNRGRASRMMTPQGNTGRTAAGNRGKRCLTVYVWLK